MPLEDDILGVLHQKIGFNPASIGADKILASVRDSLDTSRVPNPLEFIDGLRTGNRSFEQLVDAVVVPETWFFRDDSPFELLKRHVMAEWWPRQTGEPLRCLSIPSSTGEEPYSIAMTLLDAGLLPGNFSIDAVDVSNKLLQRAREGVYSRNSFRSKDLSFRDRYFETTVAGYCLTDSVKATVNFFQGNILDPMFLNDGRTYDIVFCRNLLIYFDAKDWDKAVKTLQRLLRDTGMLFMGHAETLELTSAQVEAVRYPCGFAYRKKSQSLGKPRKKTAHYRADRSTSAPAAAAHRKAAPKKSEPQPRHRSALHPDPILEEPPLEKARVLADRGSLAEASVECERFLKTHAGNAEAHFLLGLIREGQGRPRDAENCYNRAVYLDSKHREALIHLALLREGRGDMSAARALRRRCEQLK